MNSDTGFETIHSVVSAIAERDRDINSVVVHDADRVLEEAANSRRLAPSARPELPLSGLPVTVKESIDVAGYPSTAGDPSVGAATSRNDAPTVRRLRDAGAVVVGKTNVAYRLKDWQSTNPLYGTTNNPYLRDRTAGGSSAGAAAVAIGLSAGDLGSDLIGSLRVPAAFCGVFAHRPTDGTLPCSGEGRIVPRELPGRILGTQGFTAASTATLRTLLEVASARTLPTPPEMGWLHRPEGLTGARVAVPAELPWLPVSESVRSALDLVENRATELGVRVDRTAPPYWGEEHVAITCALLAAITGALLPVRERQAIRETLSARGDDFDLDWARGVDASAADYFGWLAMRETVVESYSRFFSAHDLLVAPITLLPAFEHMDNTSIWPVSDDAQPSLTINNHQVPYGWQLIYPSMASLSGLPATVFPATVHDGLPIGLQVIGPREGDLACLEFARRISIALPDCSLYTTRIAANSEKHYDH